MKKQIATLKRRGLSVFLALALCVSLVQVNAFALEPEGDSAQAGSNETPQVEVSVNTPSEDNNLGQSNDSGEGNTPGEGNNLDQGNTPSEGNSPSQTPSDTDAYADGEGNEQKDNEASNVPVDAEEKTPPAEVKVEETLNELVKPPKDYTETETGTYEQVSSNTEQSTTDEDYNNADNAEKTTTTTETKNQQRHEAIRDENGNITGYEVVNSKVETVTTVREEKKTERPNETVTDLPELKDEDENGNSVVMDGDSKYIITEKTVDPETGVETIVVKTLEKGEDDGWINTSVVTTTRTTEVKKTEAEKAPTIFKVVQDENGNVYFTVPVTENSILHAGSIVPNLPYPGKPGYNKIQQIVWTPLPDSSEVDADYVFKLTGVLMESSFFVHAAGITDPGYFNTPPSEPKNSHKVQLCVLVDADGNRHYAYCADALTPSMAGTLYDLDNLENADNLKDENATKLQSVALNGYWGRTGDVDELGSLNSLLEKVKDAIISEKITSKIKSTILEKWLTPGAAMAGTQAAIWAITNGEYGLNMEDPFNSNLEYIGTLEGECWQGTPTIFDGTFVWKERAAKAVYDYLLWEAEQAAQNPESQPPSTDLIGESDIKDIKVTVKELDTAADAATQTPSKYNTDVSFILDVERDRMFSDDLTVKILDPSNPDAEPLGTYQLVGENLKDVTYDPDTKTYTLTNIVLPNGTNITLKLSGTQVVKQNAYLVTAEGGPDVSQTFIAVEEGEKSVDLSFNLHFSVKDPEPTTPDPEDPPTPPTPGPTPTPTPKPDPTPDPEDPPVDVPDPDVPLVPGVDPEEPPVDIPDPDVPLTPAPPEVVDVPDPAVPLAPRPAKPAKTQTSVPTVTEIPDEAVPLADVPQTGDDTGLWYAMALAAAAGLVCAKLLEKKKAQ